MKVENSKNNNIFLTGFMGSGKTTTGKALAQLLEKEFYDLDSSIESFVGKPVSNIIENFGLEYFRKIENQQLAQVCQQTNLIVALGGGSLIALKNQAQVKKSGFLVYLMAEEPTLMRRLEMSYRRPLLKHHSYDDLLRERSTGYMKADFIIKTDNKKPEEIARIISDEVKNL